MAWLDKRGDIYRLVFQLGGQTFIRLDLCRLIQ